MLKKISYLSFLVVFFGSILTTSSQNRFNAVTLEYYNNATHLAQIRQSIVDLKAYTGKPITTRIVFDPSKGQDIYTVTQHDIDFVNSIHKVAPVMGCFIDSYYMIYPEWQSCKSNISGLRIIDSDIPIRISSFLNNPINKGIDIWEVGNEANAPWNMNGDTWGMEDGIVHAISFLHPAGKKTTLTLYYYPSEKCVDNCSGAPNPLPNSAYMMNNWANKFVSDFPAISQQLDYVLVSYYEDAQSCTYPPINWDQVFSDLHTTFPNAQLGFGECGYSVSPPPPAPTICNLMNQFYLTGLLNSNPSYFVKGNFWWSYVTDCVPDAGNSNWQCLADAILNGFNGPQDNPNKNILNKSSISNYPNPFNPSTQISYSIQENTFVKIKIYNSLGQEIQSLVNEYKNKGDYSVTFNGDNLPSGLYLYKIEAGNYKSTKKMLLVK